MRTLLFPLLLSCCLSLFPPLHESIKQADQLTRLIKQQSSPPEAFEDSLWPELGFIFWQDGRMEDDRIGKLVGQPDGIDFDQYGGYVTVDPKQGRALFYYFVESAHGWDKKPLLLWLNGGPGCSSLGFGAMEELGPFRVKSDGKTLLRNKYAWNEVANIIFLESPAGVGFSYSNKSSDYYLNGDRRTAEDSYVFLINWLERFPQYKNHKIFISGESYAGHYVPQLAYTILQNNKIWNRTSINLHGIAVGNAYVDPGTNEKGVNEFLWGHSMISDETYAKILRSCDFSNPKRSTECINATGSAAVETGNIDYYNIYAHLCQTDYMLNVDAEVDGLGCNFDPCSDYYIASYLNNPQVQKALHAKVGKWEACRDFQWKDRPYSMLSTFKELIASGLNLWLYSGDVDSLVPVSDTKYFIKMLGLPILQPWRPWYLDNEVGGYVVQYKGLTLVTVRGAGHEVPSYQPKRALGMISSFLQGKLPPSRESR